MLLDPFEEQLDLPHTLVDMYNRQRGEGEIVGQKDEPSIVFGIVERDATQRIRVETRCLRTDQHDGLVASQPGCLVDPAPAATPEVEATLGARHEECQTCREPMKALEIDISSIHDIERAGLDRQMVEGGDIRRFPMGNSHKTGDVAPQVQEGVQLHRPLATAELRPGEQAQAEVDRGAVEGRNGLLQLHSQGFVDGEFPRPSDQDLGEVGEDAPIVSSVGIGQRAPRDLSPEAGMIELGLKGTQTRLDVAQALPEGQLSERQTEELIATREATRPAMATIPSHTRVELVPRKEVHELSEDQLAGFHRSPSTAWKGSPGVDFDQRCWYRARSFFEETACGVICCVNSDEL